MLFLIPTAKEMTQANALVPYNLPTKVETIIKTMVAFSPQELEKIYRIKPEASQKEYQRWQDFSTDRLKCAPALDLYNGLMYRNLKQEAFTQIDRDYLSKYVAITSSLYGIISPFKMISEHRLDFNMPVTIDGQSLKSFWRADYDQFLKDKNCVISLLSSEFEAVFSPKLRQKLVKVQFLEQHQNELKTHSTISKKARGQFLLHAMKERCQDYDSLRKLSWDGFSYQELLSTEQKLVFVKTC
ncbi:peroxide stress protein YaaA [Streptococcus hyointestinalis]|uniref:peroxide stress protein YaaA n=1 Tax=Streptococcus hyointestinalis TaxID=1337 RepID=UPI003517161E